MKIAITDDKKEDRDILKGYLQTILNAKGYISVKIEEFSSGEELIASHNKYNYEIIFLDIFMQGLNGIKTAAKIRESDTKVKIVFTTTSNDFASESYNVCADGYILKPFSEDNLKNTLGHLELNSIDSRRMLRLPNNHSLMLNKISFTEFHGHYVHIQMLSGEVTKLRISQVEFLNHVSSYHEFFACNRGMIVNLQNVSKFENNCFVMSNGDIIPVSRRRITDAKKAHADYLIDSMRKGEI